MRATDTLKSLRVSPSVSDVSLVCPPKTNGYPILSFLRSLYLNRTYTKRLIVIRHPPTVRPDSA